MTFKIEARADARALAGGLLVGAAVGIALGGAFLVGGASRSSDDQQRSARFARAAADRFSEGALRAETLTMGPGALALAQRRDPLGAADHEVATAAGLHGAYVTALPAVSSAPTPSAQDLALKVSFAHEVSNPAARPFRFPAGDALQSARDLDCLTSAVYYEARGETAAGQAAVAQVVLNRVRHPGFPKSVCGVVYQGVSDGDGCQFSFACDGSIHRPKEAEAWRRAEQIAARALTGFVMPSVGNATHFHVVGVTPDWGPRLLKVAQVGLHVFYRFGGYSGAPSSFTGTPQRSAPEVQTARLDSPDAATADGRPAGQYILASATVTTPAAPAAAPAAKASAPSETPAAKPDAAKTHTDSSGT